MTDAENFSMLCMDDDFDKCAEEIDNYYRALENDQIPELNWKCPGRRPPQQQEETPKIEATVKEQQPKSLDFDFDERDSSPTGTMRSLKNQTPKTSSAKKKTTFSGVIDRMKNHGRSKMRTLQDDTKDNKDPF
ncbi:unnamed protein product [Diamesa serratosioi]